jgi:hypothetical protein
MTGMKRNLKQTLEIAETSSDPRIKLPTPPEKEPKIGIVI